MEKKQVIESVKECAKNMEMGFITDQQLVHQVLDLLKDATAGSDESEQYLDRIIDYEDAVTQYNEAKARMDKIEEYVCGIVTFAKNL